MESLQRLVDQLEGNVRQAFLDAIWDITSVAQLQAIIGHLEAGNVEAAILSLNLRAEFFEPLDRALDEAFRMGGVSALAGIPQISAPFPAALASLPDLTGDTSAQNAYRGKSGAD